MNETAIEISALGHDFGGAPILHSVDLKIPRGTVFGLLGRNGGGKTTLIRMLLGMLQPRHGSCRVLGLDPTREPLEIRRRVGYVPQQMDFDPRMTVAEALDFVGGFYPGRWRAKEVSSWLDRFRACRRAAHRSALRGPGGAAELGGSPGGGSLSC